MVFLWGGMGDEKSTIFEQIRSFVHMVNFAGVSCLTVQDK